MSNLLVAQLDYVYFVYGLVFFMLGAVCLSISRSGTLVTRWWLLGIFAICNGTAEWLRLMAVVGEATPLSDLVTSALIAVGFLVLLEFARRTHQLIEKTRISPWLHLLVLAPVLGVLLRHGPGEVTSATRLFIAAPATFWTAALFLRAAARNQELGGTPAARRARLWGGLYTAAFGVAGGLVISRSSFLPDAWPTREAFLDWTGIPIQVVRAALVAGMALSIWALAITFDPKGSVLRKQRLLFWVMSSTIAGVLAGGWFFTGWLGRLNEEDAREEAAASSAQVYDHLSDQMGAANAGARSAAELLGRLHLLDPPVDQARLDRLVDAVALLADGWVVQVLDATGTAIAASNRGAVEDDLGINFAARPDVRAVRGWRPGRFMGLDGTTQLPTYFASHPVRRADGSLVAVAVVKRSLTASQLGPLTVDRAFLVSAEGKVLVSSRSGLVGRALWSTQPPPGGVPLPAMVAPVLSHPVQGMEWFIVDGRKQLATRAPVPGTDWSLVVLRAERTEVENRFLGIAITLLLCVVVLGYFVAMQRQLGTEAALAEKRQQAEGRAREFARKADTDALTGLLNRLGFNGASSREFERSRRYQQPLSLVMLDLDHFKEVNDQLGHPAGDQVLIGVARLLESHVRESDLVARWGGEEFVVLAPMTQLPGAARLAEKLRRQMEQTSFGLGRIVTGSFGVAELQPSDTLESLLFRADQALYRVKSGNRNGVACADGDEAEAAGKEARQVPSGTPLYAQVGFAPIDADHRGLAEALQTLVRLVNAGRATECEGALAEVISRARTHFRHEEQVMAAFHYPQRPRHRQHHAMFLEDTGRFLEELEANGLTLSFRRWAVGRLLEWFQLHVMAHDVALARFLQNTGVPEPSRPALTG